MKLRGSPSLRRGAIRRSNQTTLPCKHPLPGFRNRFAPEVIGLDLEIDDPHAVAGSRAVDIAVGRPRGQVTKRACVLAHALECGPPTLTLQLPPFFLELVVGAGGVELPVGFGLF